MQPLILDVVHWTNDLNWQWRLSEPDGTELAFATVALDNFEPEYEGFVDLRSYLRLRAGSQRRTEDEATLMAQVGRWIGQAVLGRIGPLLADAAGNGRDVVLFQVPPSAAVLLDRPLELAEVAGRPLSGHGVVFVRTLTEAVVSRLPTPAPAPQGVRILAVFSLPVDVGPLALRTERRRLAEVVDRARERGAAVELLILQYGATRATLRAALADPGGWDIVHYSGHGVAGVLTLEAESGGTDPVDAGEFAELLRPARPRLKLVCLSACESAAQVVADALDRLAPESAAGDPGMAENVPDAGPQPTVTAQNDRPDGGRSPKLPGLARTIMQELGCAVLAMRYPVEDSFGVAFADAFYRHLMLGAESVPTAFRSALSEATPRPTLSLSVAAPSLLGTVAGDLRLTEPVGAARGNADTEGARTGGIRSGAVGRSSSAKLPAPADLLVGRGGPLTRSIAVLTKDHAPGGVLFYGPPGIGKTACALEVAHLIRSSFDDVLWYEVPPDRPGEIPEPLRRLQTELPAPPPADHGAAAPPAQQPVGRRVLLVVDGVDRLLDAAGALIETQWLPLLTACAGPTHVLMTSRFVPAELPPGVHTEPLPPLSWQESVLLARESPALGPILRGDLADLPATQEEVLRMLRLLDGSPLLIGALDVTARDTSFQPVSQPSDPWRDDSEQLSDLLDAVADPSAQHHLLAVQEWVRSTIAGLTVGERAVLAFLCALEETDRRDDVAGATWPNAWRLVTDGEEDQIPDLDACVRKLRSLSFLDVVATGQDPESQVAYRIPLPIVRAVRVQTAPAVRRTIDAVLGQFWMEASSGAQKDELEGFSYLVRDAGVSGARYLARLGDLHNAAALLNNAFTRSPLLAEEASTFIRLLEAILERARGTEAEAMALNAFTTALQGAPPTLAIPRFQALLDVPAPTGFDVATQTATKFMLVLEHAGHYEQALDVFDRYIQPVLGDYDGWGLLNLEVGRLEILIHTSSGPELLTEANRLLERADQLGPDTGAGFNTWNILERLLDAGRRIAKDLQEWQVTLDFNARRIASKESRGAPALEIARSRGNDVAPLVALGRLDEAQRVVMETKEVFEEHSDHAGVGSELSDLAAIELHRRRYASGAGLEAEALRLKYLRPSPEELVVSHNNYGYSALVAGQDSNGLAHAVAAGMISAQISSGRLQDVIGNIALCVSGFPAGTAPLPRSVADLVHAVEALPGIRFTAVMRSLPGPGVEATFQMVRDLLGPAADAACGQAEDTVRRFEPLLELAQRGRRDPAAVAIFDLAVVALEYFQGFQALGEAMRRLLTEDPPLPLTLGTVGASRLAVLAAVDRCCRPEAGGHLPPVHPLRELARAVDDLLEGQVSNIARTVAVFDRLVSLATAAPEGGPSVAALEGELARLGALEDWRHLMPRIRAALGGERDDQLFVGLDAIDRAVLRRVISAADGTGPVRIWVPAAT